MICIFIVASTFNLLSGADVNLQINPDSIYVGGTADIFVEVNNLKITETPVFSNIKDVSDSYSIFEINLGQNTATYKIQLWKSCN